MKKLLLLAIFSFFSSILICQLSPTDRIQTKDGRVYQGVIIEQIPGSNIKMLRIPELDTVVVVYNNVAKILRVFDDSIANEKPKKSETQYTWWSPCFNCRSTYVMLHFFGAVGAESNAFVGTGLSFGYNIAKRMQVGIGTNIMANVDNYSEYEQRVILPLTLDLKVVFSQSKRGRGAFLLCMAGGPGIPIYTPENHLISTKTGLYLNGTFGFRLNITSQFGLLLDFGYASHSLNFHERQTEAHLEHKWYHMAIARGSIFF